MKISGLALLFVTSTAFAHVGSPDVYFESNAGPYHLLITVNPPAMVPGVAQVQIRVTSGDVDSIMITPIYVNGKDQGLPPTPDAMQRSTGDPHWFEGKVWLMEPGAWELRAEVGGPKGIGKLAIPVPAYARRTLPMARGLGALLIALMLALAVGVVSIAGAAAREGDLAPAVIPSPRNITRGRIAMIAAAVLVVSILALGNWWWNAKAADLKHTMLYDAPPLEVAFQAGQLRLKMGENFWHQTRKDQWSMGLIPDHGHIMHLFLLRVPAMDRFYHLHPQQISPGVFMAKLPAIPSGSYKVFADIVRSTGFPETMVSEINLPDIAGGPFSGDDSGVSPPAFAPSNAPTTVSQLADGGRMVWEQSGTPLKAGQVCWFRFHVEDAEHKPVDDLEPYMGMAGHAEFVRSDSSVFAHIHPAGSVPMASLMIAEKDAGLPMDDGTMDHGSMDHGPRQALPVEVSFPYGFPRAGDYRLFVQVKRRGVVQTGVFDAHVRN
jgi:hypothetical protein